MMENKDWLGFDSFKTEETETKTKALRCKTLAEIMALYRNNPGMVNISKPSTLSPTIGVDNTVISEFNLVGGIFDMKRENSADGHTKHKPSKCDETKSWSKRNNKFHDE